jgi:cytochrome c
MIRIALRAAVAATFGLLACGASASQQLHLKGGCGACHMVERKLVGPSYKDIAAKYAPRADAMPYLTERVRKGGPGNWGTIPMAPTDVSKLDDKELRTLLGWILQAK